jgi:hypothetical protein
MNGFLVLCTVLLFVTWPLCALASWWMFRAEHWLSFGYEREAWGTAEFLVALLMGPTLLPFAVLGLAGAVKLVREQQMPRRIARPESSEVSRCD